MIENSDDRIRLLNYLINEIESIRYKIAHQFVMSSMEYHFLKGKLDMANELLLSIQNGKENKPKIMTEIIYYENTNQKTHLETSIKAVYRPLWI